MAQQSLLLRKLLEVLRAAQQYTFNDWLYTALLVALLWLLFKTVEVLFWRPVRFLQHFRSFGVHCFPFVPLLGQAPMLARLRKEGRLLDGLATETNISDRGDVHATCLGPLPMLSVSEPPLVKDILLKFQYCYDKSAKSHKAGLRPLLGNGLLMSEGHVWETQKGVVSAAFHFAKLRAMLPLMSACSDRFFDKWDALIDAQTLKRKQQQQHQQQQETKAKDESKQDAPATAYAEIDIHEQVAHLTLSVVSSCAFGNIVDTHPELPTQIFEAFRETLDIIQLRTMNATHIVPFINELPIASSRTFKRNVKLIETLCDKIIADRRLKESSSSLADKSADLLDLLLEYRHEQTGKPMPDKLIKDEVMNFVFAGNETTANVFAFLLYNLASHQGLWARCRDQVADTLKGEAPSVANLKNMDLINAVLQETLRLYPPAALVAKYCTRGHTIGRDCWDADKGRIFESRPGVPRPKRTGIYVPAGTSLVMNLYKIHRNEKYWPEPNKFNVFRWVKPVVREDPRSPDAKHPSPQDGKVQTRLHAYEYDALSKFSYKMMPHKGASLCYHIPFSAGHRSCLGKQFAKFELMIMLCKLLTKYELHIKPGQDVTPVMRINTQPRDGIHAYVTRLQK
jgi:cytochrome P450